MDSRLKGKNIYIGRDPNNSSLGITLSDGATPLRCNIGKPGSVPNSVSRNKGGTDAHARIAIDSFGKIMVFNLNVNNRTRVDNNENHTQMASEDSELTLGTQGNYRIKIRTVLEAAGQLLAPGAGQPYRSAVQTPKPPTEQPKIKPPTFGANAAAAHIGQGAGAPPQPPKSFDVSHLKSAYYEYNNWKLSTQKQNQRVNLVRSVVPIITMASGLLGTMLRGDNETASTISFLFMLISAICFLWSFLKMKKAAGPEEMEARLEEFQDKWRCPNPECRKILPMVSYKVLRSNYSSCPYCKAKMTE